MANNTSPQNTHSFDIDGINLTSSSTQIGKKAVAGSSVAVSGGTNVGAQEVGTHVDDAAFTVANSTVSAIAALADETSPDSVDEGDAGALRMTLDRMLHTVTRMRSSTATLSNVSTSTTNATVLAANALRIGATIFNESAQAMYVKLGTTASSSSYTINMASNSYYEVPSGYTGRIDGVLASATGTARVTELTA